MDRALSALLGFAELDHDEQYHKAARQHVQKLDKLVKENALASFANQLLEHVSPSANSISYLYLIQASLSNDADPKANDVLLSAVTKFLVSFDVRQIRYVGSLFSGLLRAVMDNELLPPAITVETVATALLRLDPSGTVLTSHHPRLIEIAYCSQSIDLVLPIIEKTIAFIPGMKGGSDDSRLLCDRHLPPTSYITPETGLTSKVTISDVQQYDMFSTLCFLWKRSWEQAFTALERIITYPCKDIACSKIMAEAYNKWLLVGLLLTGKTPPLPPLTYSGPIKAYSTYGKPYASIAKAFESSTPDALKIEFQNLGPQFWAEENNLGLMGLVLSHYQRWKIVSLQDVYSKISLQEIRQLTQSAEIGVGPQSEVQILELLGDMIQTGMLKGVVVPAANGKPAHLEFLPADEDLSEREFAAKMGEVALRIKTLAPLLKSTNERLATSKEYVRHLVKQKAREKEGGLRDAYAGFETQIEDEDLMTGIMPGA